MPDREKVIKWLEICTTTGCQEGCPYKYEGLVYKVDCQDDLMRDALVLLKWQGTVHAEDEHEEMGLMMAECGNCHNAIRRPWAYCPFCGKAVKWDDA